MSMLAGQVEHVIGVDTHRDTNTAAVIDAVTGAAVEHTECSTDAFGYKRLLAFADQHTTGRRVWAIEGTGSFGAGLTTFLLERGEWVVEIDRPARPARRDGAKSDELDAVRAAREALARDHLAAPRARGDREAMRVLLAARQGAIVVRTKRSDSSKPSSSTRPSRCVTNCAAGRPTSSWTAALGCARSRPTVSSTERPSGRSVLSLAEPYSWKPKPPSTKPSSNSSRPPPARSCSTCQESGRSPQRSSWSPGRTASASATKPRSRPSPASPRSRRAAARQSGTASTAAATGS